MIPKWWQRLTGRSASNKPIPPSVEVVVGGLYAIPCEGEHRVLKVLAFAEGVVHVRLYANRFASRPTSLDPNTLDLGKIIPELIESGDVDSIGVGHMPFSLAAFTRSHPTFIQTTPVTAEELEAIAEWKAARGGVF